ncbi:hypothetical protein B7P25_27175 [Bacillus thuringiensis]|nr:hypothetical protein B7P25_27175 [Bacillus thuringiensis]OPA02668.1 hypothetical protein BHL27_05040 [Bacillus cereus]
MKLHEVEFEILLVVFEIRVKIKKVTLGRATFFNKYIMHQCQLNLLQHLMQLLERRKLQLML